MLPGPGRPRHPRQGRQTPAAGSLASSSSSHISAVMQVFAAADGAEVRAEVRTEVGEGAVGDYVCSDAELQRQREPV